MQGWIEDEQPTQPLHVAFDLDGTLIHQTGDLEDTPRYDVISVFHFFEKLGNVMYIWSGGGVEYAKVWAQKLGLKALIVEKGSFKPDICFDDMRVNLGIISIRV